MVPEFQTPGGLRNSDKLDYWEDDGIKKSDLMPYTYPNADEIDKKIIGIFLGSLLPWDGHENAQTAIKNGFTTYKKWVREIL